MKKNIYNRLELYTLAVGLSIALGFTACSDDPYDFDGVVLGVESNIGSPSAANAKMTEVPALQKGDVFVTHDLVFTHKEVNDLGNDTIINDTVMNYCLAYDTIQYHSRWVAFRFDGSNRTKVVDRSEDDPFTDDTQISAKHWIGSKGFGYGYDRGHLCASMDRRISRDAEKQTFFMTNMSPQMASFNQKYWLGYEEYVQGLGRNASFSDTLYVVKGGTIDKDKIIGHVYRTNGKQVAIPKFYYMALLKCKSSGYEAIAFWMEHKEYGTDADKAEIARHAISIDELEEYTGIDFFHNLPDGAETEVEKTFNLSSWNL